MTKTHSKLESKYEKAEKERAELETGLDKMRDTLNKTEQTRKQFQQQVTGEGVRGGGGKKFQQLVTGEGGEGGKKYFQQQVTGGGARNSSNSR